MHSILGARDGNQSQTEPPCHGIEWRSSHIATFILRLRHGHRGGLGSPSGAATLLVAAPFH